MIFEQIWNWSGGINASWLRKLGILLGLVVWINYSNANDIIYIYIYTSVYKFWIETRKL